MILSYLPAKYGVSSTDEFLQILFSNRMNNDILVSHDKATLIINVLDNNKKINIIIDNIYKNPSLPPPKIKPIILGKLLFYKTSPL